MLALACKDIAHQSGGWAAQALSSSLCPSGEERGAWTLSHACQLLCPGEEGLAVPARHPRGCSVLCLQGEVSGVTRNLAVNVHLRGATTLGGYASKGRGSWLATELSVCGS